METPPAGPETPAVMIDAGKVIYLMPLINGKSAVLSGTCEEALRGWGYAVELDSLILSNGENGFYIPLTILELVLKDFELAVMALRGAIPKKELGFHRCLALALRVIAKEREVEELKRELVEEGRGRRPGYSSMMAKMISYKLSLELKVFTDMLTEISYVRVGNKYLWGPEADNYLAKRAHELGKRVAEVVAKEARVPLVRISSALSDTVIREVVKELKRESMLPSVYVNGLISRGLGYIAFEGGYLDVEAWFKHGVLKLGTPPEDAIVLHVLPQRSFEPELVVRAVREHEGLRAIENVAERFTPRLLRAMREWVPDDEARLNLWKAFGYVLYPKMPFRKFFVLVGPPGAGKSTFLDFLHHALGPENVAAVSLGQILGPKSEYYVAELHHKLANLGDEGLQSSIYEFKYRSFEILKNLVGGSYITARTLYSRPFKFVNYAKLFFAVNDEEAVKSLMRDSAVAKRLIVINFSKSFEDDPDFKERILKESEKAMPVMLAALRVLAKEGFAEHKNSEGLLEKFLALCEEQCEERSDGYFLLSSLIRRVLKVSPEQLCKALKDKGMPCRIVIWHGRRGIVVRELEEIE